MEFIVKGGIRSGIITPSDEDMKIVSVDIFLYEYKEDFSEWGTQKFLGALIDDEQGSGV